MGTLNDLYGHSLALLTDLYQITMAYAHWKAGTSERQAVFHLAFRKQPFEGGFAVACGLAQAVEYIERFRFDESDIEYLATLTGNDKKPLFEQGFLEYLSEMKPQCTISAIEEGTVLFAHEPLMRVEGPILQCQLFETPLINIVGYQTLVATKAARVKLAAQNDAVLEFGLRRAQGIDGGLAASRASYIGGCDGTSNTLAGKLYGIPVRGTMAHSWIMTFDDEMLAFETYAKAMPNNSVFLVDTYDTIEGVKHAAEVGRAIEARGHKFGGIRLDSGDLAYLSIEARKILDEAGLQSAAIIASNELDEEIVQSLKQQGAAISVWAVGTKLVTAYDQPALGAVYKLSAIRESESAPWSHRIKLSEQAIKVSTPGRHQVRRYFDSTGMLCDMIYDIESGVQASSTIVDPMDPTRRRKIPADATHEDLLVPIFTNGKKVYDVPAASVSRERRAKQLARLHPGVKRFVNAHQYPVGLESSLHELKTRLVLEKRGFSS